jgi:alanine racemase
MLGNLGLICSYIQGLSMARHALALLSTEHLLHNLEVIRCRARGRSIIAMIKANAYGHGLRSTAQRLEPHVENFGVASIDEALALRKVGIKKPITLMEGVFERDELLVASCQNFHVVFHHQEQIAWLDGMKLPRPLYGWLKVDTGMGRLGVHVSDALSLYSYLASHRNVQEFPGLMSHLACADDRDNPLNSIQQEQFGILASQVAGKKSFANSPALFNFSREQLRDDVVRPGLALYGISPIAGTSAAQLGLKSVMTLQTRLIAVRMFDKGAALGYGGRFICPERMPVGVIAMGYGDGYPRTARDGTPVLVNGVRCQVVGRVSMDMASIDLRSYPQAQVGDQVVLWGDELPIEQVACHTDNIPYDLICGVQQRVTFYWTM